MAPPAAQCAAEPLAAAKGDVLTVNRGPGGRHALWRQGAQSRIPGSSELASELPKKKNKAADTRCVLDNCGWSATGLVGRLL